MTTETRISRKEIEKFTIAQIVDDARVQRRFEELANARSKTRDGAAMYVRATESFMRAVSEDENLRQCTPLSLYSAFLDMGFFGLTVSKEAKPLAYLLWNNVKGDGNNYEKRATLSISPYGELAIRQAMGQIKHADDPVIVYEGDEYSGIYYKDGQKCIDYRRDPKMKSNKIVAAFLKITRTDDTVDYSVLDMKGVERLEGYSERKNRGSGANKLYSSNNGQIDEGFLKAKLIKHAFSSYPKVHNPTATTIFESERVVEDVYDYGIDDVPQTTDIPVAETEEADFEVEDESSF